MPNPIIQNYLNDTTIPKEKRAFAMSELKKGVPEEKIASGITKAYGDRFLDSNRKDPSGNEMSVEEFLQKQAADPSFHTNYAHPIGPVQQTSIPTPTPQPQQQNMSLGDRIKGALSGTIKAAGEGLNTIAGGVENMKAPKRAMDQGSYMIEQAKKQLAQDGDQEKFDKKMAVIKKMMGSAMDRSNLGASEVFKGGVDTAISPVTGAFTGGLKPELDKLSQFVTKGVQGMSQKNQGRLMNAINTIHSFTSKHPALMNYASGGLDLAGLGVGGKVVKGGVKTLEKGVKSLAVGAKDAGQTLGEFGVDLAKMGGGVASDLVKGAKNKIPKISTPGKSTADDIATKLLTPEINQKNLRIAASKGLAVEGKKGLFTGGKDMIKLNSRMEEVKKTLLSHFPDIHKISSFNLPVKIESKIGEIASPLRESFQKIVVPKSIKTGIVTNWTKLKKSQLDKSFNTSWLKDIQKTFENEYISKISKKVKDATGKYRQKNADDVWRMITDYDKRNSKLIEAVEKGSSDPSVLTKFDAYIENRRLLRKTIDELASHMDDLEAQKAFKEMSDLYEAQGRIIENIKPTNKSGTSVAKDLAKGYGKQAVAALAGGTAAGVFLK